MTDHISFRNSTPADLERIMPIYRNAVSFMRLNGNNKQWTGGYPSQEVILKDICNHNHYIAENWNGEILAVFSFIIGDDPTYSRIYDGEWLNAMPYGTIHRIANAGRRHRMMEECVKFCFSKIDNIRIDTHEDNSPMLNAINRLGFSRCGIIYLADGAPRIAFHKSI